MTPRPATPDDAGLLARLHATAFDRPWSEAEFSQFLASGAKGVLADDAGCILWRAIAGEAEILTLAVDPARRREGLGQALLTAAMDAANAQALFLEVADDNDAALALYAQAGFEAAGRRRDYYRRPGGVLRDALILRRALNRP